MAERVRMSRDDRRGVIIRAAVALTRASSGCINSWTRNDVARKCSPPTSIDTVKNYFTMPELREAVRVVLRG